MAPPPADETPPRILPALILGGVALILAITVLGWVIGAILAVVRFVLIVAVAIAVIWAVLALRSDR